MQRSGAQDIGMGWAYQVETNRDISSFLSLGATPREGGLGMGRLRSITKLGKGLSRKPLLDCAGLMRWRRRRRRSFPMLPLSP